MEKPYHKYERRRTMTYNQSKKVYAEWLNDLGCPEHDHPENDGRVPWKMVDKYGDWLRRNDPIAFEVGFGEWKQGSC